MVTICDYLCSSYEFYVTLCYVFFLHQEQSWHILLISYITLCYRNLIIVNYLCYLCILKSDIIVNNNNNYNFIISDNMKITSMENADIQEVTMLQKLSEIFGLSFEEVIQYGKICKIKIVYIFYLTVINTVKLLCTKSFIYEQICNWHWRRLICLLKWYGKFNWSKKKKIKKRHCWKKSFFSKLPLNEWLYWTPIKSKK